MEKAAILNRFKIRSHFWKLLVFAFLFPIVALFSSSSFVTKPAKGDVIKNDAAGTWEGTLGPTEADIDKKNPNNSAFSITHNIADDRYEAGLTGNYTDGNIISSTIAPDSNKFKSWRQVSVSVVLKHNSTVTFDILCGDQSNSQCAPFNEPLPGFSNLPATGGVIDISGIPSSIKQIRIRAIFGRQNDQTASALLTHWSASWLVKDGVSLIIYKTPNPANPEPYENPPEAGTQNVVTYTLVYSLDRNVDNMSIEIPIPTASHHERNYALIFRSATRGGYCTDPGNCGSGDKIIWNLGNRAKGEVGELSATFSVPIGPPDGSTFKTAGTLSGDGLSNIGTGTDLLTISAKSYLEPRLLGPNNIGPNTLVTYLLQVDTAYLAFQGDMFNTRFTLNYSACTPTIEMTSVAPLARDDANHIVTFDMGTMYMGMGGKVVVVQLRDNGTCSGWVPVVATLTVSSEQDPVFVQIKSQSRGATFTSNTAMGVTKNTWDATTAPGYRIDSFFRFYQDSTIVLTNFYAIDMVPENTVFFYTSFSTGYLSSHNIPPATPFHLYVHNRNRALGPPTKDDPNWRRCPTVDDQEVCDAAAPGSPYGANVTWIKWQVDSMYWDRMENDDPHMGQFVFRVNDILPAGTTEIVNTINYYSDQACQAGCPSTIRIPITNIPQFLFDFHADRNPVPAGESTTLQGGVHNIYLTTSDAKEVLVIMDVPKPEYLDPLNPTDNEQAKCVINMWGNESTNCPDEDGIVVNNAPWLRGTYDAASSTVHWHIPLMYSSRYYPQNYPSAYSFRVTLNIRVGIAKFTVAECNKPEGKCYIAATGKNANKTQTASGEREIEQPIVISSTIVLDLTKVPAPEHPSVDQTMTYTLTVLNNSLKGSTGTAVNVFIIDNIPVNTEYNPPARLFFDEAPAQAGVERYWMQESDRIRTADPPKSFDAAWRAFPITVPKTDISWVMWKLATPLALDDSINVTLQLKVASDVPNGTWFQNKAVAGMYVPAINDDMAVTNNQPTSITVSNPGFIETYGGDVGAMDDIDIGASGTQHTASYLVIAENLVANVFSAKHWLVGGYDLNPAVLNFNRFWSEYEDKANAHQCDTVGGCLGNQGGDGGIKKYSGTTFPVKINDPTNYLGNFLVLFINGDLEINNNLSVGAEKGIIFVVRGDVKVNGGVAELNSMFLVSGKFDSGSLSKTVTTGKDAGKFSAISIGRDGFPRIVYMVNDDVRYIKCNDYNCDSRTFSYLGTINSVSSIFMELEPVGNVDLARIVVGQESSQTQTGGKVYYFRCQNDTCRNSDSKVIEKAWYPDIALDSSDSYKPNLSWGFDQPNPNQDKKMSSYVLCSNSYCDSRTVTDLDDQGATGSKKDMGLDTQISIDKTTFTPVITYVYRSGSNADLYMARYVGNDGNCPLSNQWECVRMHTAGMGQVGRFPSLELTNAGYLRAAFNDFSKEQLQYLICSNAGNYKLCPQDNRSISAEVDCPGGSVCEVLDYVSLKLNNSDQPRIVYNVKDHNLPPQYEVRFTWCNSNDCSVNSNWGKRTIQGPVGAGGVHVYTQALALGREAGDAAVDYPRIVVYHQENRELRYVRCTAKDCSSMIIKTLDTGGNLLLPDLPLTINGAVMAFDDVLLNRDRLDESSTQPGEIFTYEPKYLYFLARSGVLNERVSYREVAP